MGKNKDFNLEEYLLENLKTRQYRKEYFVGNTASKILLFYIGFFLIVGTFAIEFLHFNESLVVLFSSASGIIGLMFCENKKESLKYQEEIAKMELDKFYLDKKIKNYLVLRLIKILTI